MRAHALRFGEIKLSQVQTGFAYRSASPPLNDTVYVVRQLRGTPFVRNIGESRGEHHKEVIETSEPEGDPGYQLREFIKADRWPKLPTPPMYPRTRDDRIMQPVIGDEYALSADKRSATRIRQNIHTELGFSFERGRENAVNPSLNPIAYISDDGDTLTFSKPLE